MVPSLRIVKGGDTMSDFMGRLQSMREHNRLEFKKATGNLPKSFWESYSSFANTEGGVIVLGADEGLDGYPVPTGIKDVEQVRKQLWDGLNNPQRASANILADSDVTIEAWEGKSLIVVNVPRADRRVRPVYVGNNPKTGTYRRNGEGDYHVTEEAYLSLVRDSLRDPIDSVVLDEFTLEDLYDETVQAYRNRFESVRPKSPLGERAPRSVPHENWRGRPLEGRSWNTSYSCWSAHVRRGMENRPRVWPLLFGLSPSHRW